MIRVSSGLVIGQGTLEIRGRLRGSIWSRGDGVRVCEGGRVLLAVLPPVLQVFVSSYSRYSLEVTHRVAWIRGVIRLIARVAAYEG